MGGKMEAQIHRSIVQRLIGIGDAGAASTHKDLCAKTTRASEAARAKLLSVGGDPFLKVTWEPSVFFHFEIEPELVRPVIPKHFELELHEGLACLSLAAVRMKNFRPCRLCSPGLFFRALREQRFLNVRIYGKCRGEPGILFLHGWLSRPTALPVLSGSLGLAYTFARLE